MSFCFQGGSGSARVLREAFLGESRLEPDEVLLQMRLEPSDTKGFISGSTANGSGGASVPEQNSGCVVCSGVWCQRS